MKVWANPGALFTFLILLLFVGGVFTARHWELQARMFPWVIGIPALLICVRQLTMDLFQAESSDNSDIETGFMDLPVDRGVPVSVVIRRAANIFGWIFGFFVTIWLVGFILSVPIYVFLYLFVQARETIRVSLLYTGAMLAFLIGVFHFVLHIPWPPGIISAPQELIISWIGI